MIRIEEIGKSPEVLMTILDRGILNSQDISTRISPKVVMLTDGDRENLGCIRGAQTAEAEDQVVEGGRRTYIELKEDETLLKRHVNKKDFQGRVKIGT